jgi:uncharacterized glyoxalase superfamily protein PhnB
MTDSTPPSPLQAQALSASLTVRDLQTSLAWYCDSLGFTVDRRIEVDGRLRSVAVRAGSVRILLNQDDGMKGSEREKGQGFSLMITTHQDVDAVASRIRRNGGTLESEPANTPWGARAFRVRDPDGFRYAISS